MSRSFVFFQMDSCLFSGVMHLKCLLRFRCEHDSLICGFCLSWGNCVRTSIEIHSNLSLLLLAICNFCLCCSLQDCQNYGRSATAHPFRGLVERTTERFFHERRCCFFERIFHLSQVCSSRVFKWFSFLL